MPGFPSPTLQDLTVLGSITGPGAINTAALTALILTLPTTLPGTSGQLWLDNGVLSISLVTTNTSVLDFSNPANSGLFILL